MEMMWVCGVIVLLVSEAQSLDSGTNRSTSVNPSTSPLQDIKFYVVRNQSVNLGSDANLTCTNKTWNEMLYIIWTISLKNKQTNKQCRIHFSDSGGQNDCNDGKSLHNTSSAQSYLHIPKVSANDEGVYNCESIYRGGGDNVKLYVYVTVAPSVSAWLEKQDKRTLAVCRAKRGKPAASIMWKNAGNSSFMPTVETQRDPDGFFTVQSWLVLPEGNAPENLTCSVQHSFWEGEKIVIPKPIKDFSWGPLYICVIVIIPILVVFLFFAQKNLLRRRLRFNMSQPEAKSPPAEDVEEVEPYASYIQRVNSIYNSSADLFT